MPSTLPKFTVRFETKVQRELIRRAAKMNRRSMNFFMLDVTLKAAREALKQDQPPIPQE